MEVRYISEKVTQRRFNKKSMLKKEIGELEELLIEDISPVKEEDVVESLPEVDGIRIEREKFSGKFFDSVLALFKNENICSMFLDKNLTILDVSPAAHKLLGRYHTVEKKPLFNVLGNVLSKKAAVNFFESIRSPKKGYSWAGVLLHTTRGLKTMYTKMNVMPLFENKEVVGFWVIFEDITQTYFEQHKSSLLGLLEASKLKDNDTGFHNERLNHYSKALSIVLYNLNIFTEIDNEFIDNISFLAAMHDVGKIGTPDYILQKPGKLNDTEWKIMREHTINGGLILSNFPFGMAKEMALSHHERWDGNGYPYNLVGEMIPLSARIIAIADVYDALRMRRPYKAPYSHQMTVKHILEGGNTHFDPRITRTFEKAHFLFDKIWMNMRDDKGNCPINEIS